MLLLLVLLCWWGWNAVFNHLKKICYNQQQLLSTYPNFYAANDDDDDGVVAALGLMAYVGIIIKMFVTVVVVFVAAAVYSRKVSFAVVEKYSLLFHSYPLKEVHPCSVYYRQTDVMLVVVSVLKQVAAC